MNENGKDWADAVHRESAVREERRVFLSGSFPAIEHGHHDKSNILASCGSSPGGTSISMTTKRAPGAAASATDRRMRLHDPSSQSCRTTDRT